MIIQHRDNGKKGAFYLENNNDVIAELTYVWAGEKKFIIEHTEVAENLEGQGVGKELVRSAVEFARENHVTVIPLCTYANAVIQRTKEFQDVLDK